MMEINTSKIGGTATLIGDPPNIMIAGATELTFVDFIVNLAPIAFVAFVVVTGLLYLWFRSRLQIAPAAKDRVMELDARRSIEDPEELKRSLPVLVGTILLFFVHKPLHLEPATVAMLGATVLLLVTTQPLDRTLSEIQWPALFFFIGLFVMVGALEETGAIGEIADGVADLTGGDRTAELMGITWISAIASGIVDNIPFTATMIPVVEQLQGERMDDAYGWAPALGACFGATSPSSPPPAWPNAAADRFASPSSSRSASRPPWSPCCSPLPTFS